MHELGYGEAVLHAVLRRAGDRPVSAVGVRVGATHRLVAEAFQQGFAVAALGTAAADARTELTVVPAQGHCLDCRHDFSTADPEAACPACGALAVAVTGGDELFLEWVAYAEQPREDDPEAVDRQHHHGEEDERHVPGDPRAARRADP